LVVHVGPYQRQDGTWVRAHTRKNPSSSGGSNNSSAGGGLAVAAVVILGLFGWFGLADGEGTADQPPVVWETHGVTFTQVNEARDESCTSQSFGDVQEFFLEQPCSELHRALLTTEDANGNEILVAVFKTVMPTTEQAADLRALVDRSGTGNVADLAGQTFAYMTTEFTGQHYASQITGPAVLIAEAEAVRGQVDTATLKSIAQQALAYPYL
jgi:hypothetical protein